ncbi:MAG: outer membrane protein [Candidatus Paracaedibacter sp.]
MKKLALALIASTVALSAANANHISTGFYLGAHAGYGSLTGKVSNSANNTGSSDFGSNFGNIGIHGGYGWVTGCLYLGGELSYTFENAKANNTLGGNGNLQLKRNGYARAALRGGYLFTPSTMGYIALGGNWGKYTLNDSLTVPNNTISGSKNRLSFAPGVGVETAVHKNVYLRLEYNYEFGPSVRATSATNANNFTNVGTIRSQSGKVGLSYKF